MAASQSERYKRWYDKNKKTLSARRKARYHNDPQYRQKALDNRRKSLPKSDPLPEGYVHTFSDAADMLDVSIWKLREWRRKNYYPEPLEHGRALYFTQAQVELLGKLRNFLSTAGMRMTDEAKNHLDVLTNLIHANWN